MRKSTLSAFLNNTVHSSYTAPLKHDFLEHSASLSLDPSQVRFSNTKTICSIGSSTKSEATLQRLLRSGMSIASFNLSEMSYDECEKIVKYLRNIDANERPYPTHLGYALEISCIRVKTGQLKSNEKQIEIEKKSPVKLTNDITFKDKCSQSTIYVDYSGLYDKTKWGEKIVIQSGLTLSVKNRTASALTCVVEKPGFLASKDDVYFLGHNPARCLSVKDKADVNFAAGLKFNFVFACYVLNGNSVREIRRCIGEDRNFMKIIAKVDSLHAIDNIDEIIEAADGILFVRESVAMYAGEVLQVILLQKMVISKCLLAGKPVICGTKMLESMVNSPTPILSEISDIANAVIDGVDGLMLGPETANGLYPDIALQTLNNACMLNDRGTPYWNLTTSLNPGYAPTFDLTESLCYSVVNISMSGIAVIIILACNGQTAELVAKYRPPCPVIVVTTDPAICSRCQLFRGLIPLLSTPSHSHLSWPEQIENEIEKAMQFGQTKRIIRRDEFAVVMFSNTVGDSVNSIRIINVNEIKMK